MNKNKSILSDINEIISYYDEAFLKKAIIRYLPSHLKSKVEHGYVDLILDFRHNLKRIKVPENYWLYYDTIYEYNDMNGLSALDLCLKNVVVILLHESDAESKCYYPMHVNLKRLYYDDIE